MSKLKEEGQKLDEQHGERKRGEEKGGEE